VNTHTKKHTKKMPGFNMQRHATDELLLEIDPTKDMLEEKGIG
jgi:hypothetical protein